MQKMPPIVSKKLRGVSAVWQDFQTRLPVKLRTVQNEQNYQTMVNFLDELVDEMGDQESHPLIGLLDIVSMFVYDYEERDIENSDSGRPAVRRDMRPKNRATVSRANKSSRARISAQSDGAIVYRGIKIPRINGKRSPTSLALREALLTKYRR